jgi:hypothetical protein
VLPLPKGWPVSIITDPKMKLPIVWNACAASASDRPARRRADNAASIGRSESTDAPECFRSPNSWITLGWRSQQVTPAVREPPAVRDRVVVDRLGERELLHHAFDHRVQQIVLVAHVVVQRHGLDSDLARDAAHRDRVQPLGFHQTERGLGDPVPGERDAGRLVCRSAGIAAIVAAIISAFTAGCRSSHLG